MTEKNPAHEVGSAKAQPVMGTMGTKQDHGLPPSAGTPSGVDAGANSTMKPLHRPARTPDGDVGSYSVHPPDRQAVTSSRTVEVAGGVDNTPVSPPDREQQPGGDQAQPAQGTSFGSTRNLVDPSWDNGESLAQRVQQILRSSKGGARDLSTASLREESFTQRGSPIEAPLPFSGLGPVAGSAAGSAGSSGVGSAPLLAVIVSCFFAFVCLNLARVYNAFLKPGTVSRLALERPG